MEVWVPDILASECSARTTWHGSELHRCLCQGTNQAGASSLLCNNEGFRFICSLYRLARRWEPGGRFSGSGRSPSFELTKRPLACPLLSDQLGRLFEQARRFFRGQG